MYRIGKVKNRSKIINVSQLNKNYTIQFPQRQYQYKFNSFIENKRLFSSFNSTTKKSINGLIQCNFHFNKINLQQRGYSAKDTDSDDISDNSSTNTNTDSSSNNDNVKNETKQKGTNTKTSKDSKLSLDEIEEKIKNMDRDEIEELMKQAWKDGNKRKKQVEKFEMQDIIRETEKDLGVNVELDQFDRDELAYRLEKKEQERKEFEESQKALSDAKNPFYATTEIRGSYDAPLHVEEDIVKGKKILSEEYEQDQKKRQQQAKSDEIPFIEKVQNEIVKREKMIFLFLAIFFLSMAFGPLYYGLSSESWPETTGVVMPLLEGKQAVVPIVKYKVDGVTYGTQFWSWKYWSSFEELGELDLTSRYPPGTKIPVYFNPSNPGMAVLEPGIGSGGFSALGAGLGMIAALVFKNSWGRGVPAFGACCLGGMGTAAYIKRNQRKETARRLEEEAARMGS